MSKYIGEFTSYNGTDYKVEIITENKETPEVNVTMGASPFTTEMDSDGKTIYAPIKSQGATVEIVTGDIPFDLYSGQSLGTSIKLTNTTANKVEFVGYLTPCAYTQPFDQERETLELDCVDGLAVLKDLRYRSTNKDVETFLNIVFNCLKRANCYKNLYVNDNVQLSASLSESVMSKLRVSEANFFDDKDYEAQSDDDVAMSCYDVLFEIVQYMGYTIVAEGEDVYIIDYDAIVKGRKKYFKYSLTGSTIGSPTTVEVSDKKAINENSYAENGTSVSLSEVFNKICVVDDFHKIDSLIDGLDNSKNYTNITASSDATLLNWMRTDDRFLESAVFTKKNGQGEDESFFVSLTKGDIFFVYGKFFSNPLITTYHYSHSNASQPESSYNPMSYSKLWNGKGASVVGLWTKKVESKKYNEWRSNIGNWDSLSQDQKLQKFADLVNIANLGSKTLTNYILCLNQDTNHIEHDRVKNYPFFKITKDVPATFGGTGGYLIIKGTLIRHYQYNAPFPQNGDCYVHKDEKKTSIYSGEGYFWARLKWGNKYWKGGDTYTETGEWVNTATDFKIWYNDPTSEIRTDKWLDKDSQFFNTCVAWGVNDENGYYIPAPEDGNLSGQVEFTVYANKDTKGKWARNNKGDKKNSYKGFPPKVVLFKGIDIKIGYADDAQNDDAFSADTVYSNDPSVDFDNLREGDEVKMKVCTFDNKTPSYSTVDYLDSANKSQYLDTAYNQATGQELRMEHHAVVKIVSQYQEPRVVFEATLKRSLGIKPWTVLTDKTLSGRSFIVNTMAVDYRRESTEFELNEKTTNYD